MNNRYEILPDGKTCQVFFRDGNSFLIDAEDLKLIEGVSWSRGKRGYPVSHTSRKDPNGHKAITLHRLLLGFPKEMDIDHISGDKMDNRKSNLRVCTHEQNMFNQKLRATNSSGNGVSYHKQARKFEAYIHIDGKKKYLGLYSSLESASAARDAATRQYCGEYGRLNADLVKAE